MATGPPVTASGAGCLFDNFPWIFWLFPPHPSHAPPGKTVYFFPPNLKAPSPWAIQRRYAGRPSVGFGLTFFPKFFLWLGPLGLFLRLYAPSASVPLLSLPCCATVPVLGQFEAKLISPSAVLTSVPLTQNTLLIIVLTPPATRTRSGSFATSLKSGTFGPDLRHRSRDILTLKQRAITPPQPFDFFLIPRSFLLFLLKQRGGPGIALGHSP